MGISLFVDQDIPKRNWKSEYVVCTLICNFLKFLPFTLSELLYQEVHSPYCSKQSVIVTYYRSRYYDTPPPPISPRLVFFGNIIPAE